MDSLKTKLTSIMAALGWDEKYPDNWDQMEDKLGWLLEKIRELTEGEASKVGLHFKMVDELPEEGEENYFYLVPSKNAAGQDIYQEYLWVESKFEKLGSTDIKIDNYYTKSETDNLLEQVIQGTTDSFNAVKDELEVMDNELQDEISTREEKHTELQSSIESEINRAKSAEETNSSNISAEVTRATEKESEIEAKIPTKVSDLENDSAFITSSALNDYAKTSDLEAKLTAKQDALVSGTSIKTINNQSLLGEGNISITGGTGSGTTIIDKYFWLTDLASDGTVSSDNQAVIEEAISFIKANMSNVIGIMCGATDSSDNIAWITSNVLYYPSQSQFSSTAYMQSGSTDLFFAFTASTSSIKMILVNGTDVTSTLASLGGKAFLRFIYKE